MDSESKKIVNLVRKPDSKCLIATRHNKNTHNSETELARPIRFGTKKSDPNFTGRTNELSTLDEHYEKHDHIVVVGLGGIGKTSLVRKYVENEKFKLSNVIWINAEQRESIEKDFEKLATNKLGIKTLNANDKKNDIESILDDVLRHLCILQTLIVLDNVFDEEIQEFVQKTVFNIQPPGSHRLRYVITSRIQSWNRKSVSVIPIRGLADTEAVDLVTRLLVDVGSGHNDSLEDIKKLVKNFQHFPLAIRQATAHIRYQREVRPFSIYNYIDKYNSCKQEYLSSEHFQEECYFDYKETTFTTWNVTIAAIAENQKEGDLAIRILRIIAYFKADNIPRDIFFHLNHPSSVEKINEKDIKSAVGLLVNYSMIEGCEEQSILIIHRLVQTVVKISMESADIASRALSDGLKILHDVMYNQSLKDYEKELVEHGISVFKSAIALEDLVREFSFFPSMVLRKANECGRYGLGISFREQILHPLINILGADHPEIISLESIVPHFSVPGVTRYGVIARKSKAALAGQILSTRRDNEIKFSQQFNDQKVSQPHTSRNRKPELQSRKCYKIK